MTDQSDYQTARRFLIPLPARIEPAEGSFPWPDTILFEPWADLSARSSLHLDEFGDALRAELRIGFEESPPEQEPHFGIFLQPLVPPGFREQDFPAAAGPLRNDAYLLAVGERITLWAGGEPGLFYGLETLLQLLRAGARTRRIPGLVIRDVPAFAHRMVQYDIAREQTVRMPYLKRVIRRLASLKINEVMLYLEYRYRWTRHPAFGPPDTLTAGDARELTEFANRYCVDLIPQVNVLGHVEGFLRHETYARLREVPDNPYQLCPTDPKSFELFRELIEEMLPHFDSPFFHVGGDESHLLGRCPRCKAKMEKDGIAALYADYMARYHELLASHGKRMMIWGDIVLQHRDIAPRLPRDVIIFDWHYQASSPDTLDFFQNSGFDVYASPSVGGYVPHRFLTGWHRADTNTGPFFRDAAERSVLGACLTTWEMFFGHFFQNNWYPVAYGSAAAWNPAEPSEGGLSERFGEAFMDEPENTCVALLRILTARIPEVWGGFAGESDAPRIRAVFHDPDPLRLPRLVADQVTEEQLKTVEALLEEADGMLHQARRRQLRNADVLEWLGFIIRMYRSVLLRIRAFWAIHKTYGEIAAESSGDARASKLVSVLGILLQIRDDMDSYLTNQATAVERYGSSIHDLERYRRQVESLSQLICGCLAALRPDGELPTMKEMGLEE